MKEEKKMERKGKKKQKETNAGWWKLANVGQGSGREEKHRGSQGIFWRRRPSPDDCISVDVVENERVPKAPEWSAIFLLLGLNCPLPLSFCFTLSIYQLSHPAVDRDDPGSHIWPWQICGAAAAKGWTPNPTHESPEGTSGCKNTATEFNPQNSHRSWPCS